MAARTFTLVCMVILLFLNYLQLLWIDKILLIIIVSEFFVCDGIFDEAVFYVKRNLVVVVNDKYRVYFVVK